MTTAKRILIILLTLVLMTGLTPAVIATDGGGVMDPGDGITGDFEDEEPEDPNPPIIIYPPIPKKVTLSFESNGGPKIESLKLEKGTTVDLAFYYTIEREGYVLTGWYADKNLTMKIDEITVVENTTIYADWEEIVLDPYKDCPRDNTCPMYPYLDLNPDLWYHDGIHFCIDNGLMGSTNTEKLIFNPSGTTTRAMIVTILWRLEGSPAVDYLMTFEDVASNTWYTEAIRWAAAEGIVTGYSDIKFGPNDPITREQMATIMWRYADGEGYDITLGENTDLSSFGDADDVSAYAVPAMKWACATGLVQGIASGTVINLVPQGNATRAQSATILYRFCEYFASAN